MSVAEHVAVVTGGSRGIGRAVVQELTSSGIRVAFTYRRDHEAADTLCRQVKEQGGEAIGFQQDVTDFAGVRAILADIQERFGQIDRVGQ